MLTGIFQGLSVEFIMIFDLSETEMSCILTFGMNLACNRFLPTKFNIIILTFRSSYNRGNRSVPKKIEQFIS